MLNSGKKICDLFNKKNKKKKKMLNETKNHNPPLQVKWSVPNKPL